MQLTTRLPKRRGSSRPTRTPPPAPPAKLAPPETRAARRGGGPEDVALYSCLCGYVFKAAVTTSVACPHCSTEQAW